MVDIDLLIKTRGRGRTSIEDSVRRALERKNLYTRGSYAFEDSKRQALATLQRVVAGYEGEREAYEVNERALPGLNYIIRVGHQPGFIYRVVDAVDAGEQIAEDYLAGKEGRLHNAWRHVAELADWVFRENWERSEPVVEFAVVVPSHGNSPGTVVYSAKYGLTNGKVACHNENRTPRKL